MIEPEAEVVDAPKRGLRDGGAQVRGDVLRCGVGEDVRVRVDEAGKHGVGGEIGDRDAGGSGVGDGLHAIAGDEDVGVGADVAGATSMSLPARTAWVMGLWSCWAGAGKRGRGRKAARKQGSLNGHLGFQGNTTEASCQFPVFSLRGNESHLPT